MNGSLYRRMPLQTRQLSAQIKAAPAAGPDDRASLPGNEYIDAQPSRFVRQLQHPMLIAGSANTPTNFEFSQKALQCGVLVNLISECMDNRAITDMDERWRREGIAASYMV
jgi:hypothetical protein